MSFLPVSCNYYHFSSFLFISFHFLLFSFSFFFLVFILLLFFRFNYCFLITFKIWNGFLARFPHSYFFLLRFVQSSTFPSVFSLSLSFISSLPFPFFSFTSLSPCLPFFQVFFFPVSLSFFPLSTCFHSLFFPQCVISFLPFLFRSISFRLFPFLYSLLAVFSGLVGFFLVLFFPRGALPSFPFVPFAPPLSPRPLLLRSRE